MRARQDRFDDDGVHEDADSPEILQTSRATTELLAGDEVLATAILDRLLHRAHVLNIKGRSHRLRDLEQSLGVQRQ